jgi:hypothetical protein
MLNFFLVFDPIACDFRISKKKQPLAGLFLAFEIVIIFFPFCRSRAGGDSGSRYRGSAAGWRCGESNPVDLGYQTGSSATPPPPRASWY